MIYPNKKEYFLKTKKFNIVPVYEEFIADIETPVSIFIKAGGLEMKSFLLESIEGAKNITRYSFIGIGYEKIIIFDEGLFSILNGGEYLSRIETNTPLDEIKKIMEQYHPYQDPNLEHFTGGAVGYVGYDIVKYFDDINIKEKKTGFPEIMLFLTDSLVVFDHMMGRIKIISTIKIDNNMCPGKAYELSVKKIETIRKKIYNSNKVINSNLKKYDFYPQLKDIKTKVDLKSKFEKEIFIKSVEKIKSHIINGDIFQAVLSQRFSTTYNKDPFNIYRALRTLNPSPYMFFINFTKFKIIGSSPEPLLKIKKSKIYTFPIAGTRKRGISKSTDRYLASELLKDEKEKAEHNMLVDLARNDLGRVSKLGSVKIAKYMYIEKYSHVMHLVSRVEGILDEDKTIYDAFKSTFPAGTLTGAPKIRAMQIISDLEPECRGPYGGVVGYFGYNGDLDTCITIRTAIVEENRVHVQAGAGIVYDSVAENEWEETINKATVLFKAINLTR